MVTFNVTFYCCQKSITKYHDKTFHIAQSEVNPYNTYAGHSMAINSMSFDLRTRSLFCHIWDHELNLSILTFLFLRCQDNKDLQGQEGQLSRTAVWKVGISSMWLKIKSEEEQKGVRGYLKGNCVSTEAYWLLILVSIFKQWLNVLLK